jgi:hypothetical protein
MLKLPVIIYTHSSYRDVLIPCLDRLNKYCPTDGNIYVCSEKTLGLSAGYVNLLYDDSACYTQRIRQCLSKISDPMLLFLHEDMILYAPANEYILGRHIDFLMLSPEHSYIRLFRTVNTLSKQITDTLFLCDNWYFCVQPSLVKKEALNIMVSQDFGIRDFEPGVQEVCLKNNLKGLFSYCGEKKRGEAHYDSDVFPFISTAIVKGKWNLSEYPKEISSISKEYNINLANRRTC